MVTEMKSQVQEQSPPPPQDRSGLQNETGYGAKRKKPQGRRAEMGIIECIQKLREIRTPGGSAITQKAFVPPPPMTQEQMEQDISANVAAGVISPEGAANLLRRMALETIRRKEHGAYVVKDAILSKEDIAFDRRRRLRQTFQDAGLKPEYWGLRIDQSPFLTDKGNEYEIEPGNEKAFGAMRALASSWETGSRGITLQSVNRGVSKTLLAAAVMVYIKAMKLNADGKPVRIRFVKAGELFDAIAKSYGSTWEKNPGVMSTEQVWQEYAALPEVLIIDDLGTEPFARLDIGEWTREQFYRLADHRHSAKLTTIITTQLDADALTSRYGGHVTSRLLARSPLVPITTDTDYRQDAEVDYTDPWA